MKLKRIFVFILIIILLGVLSFYWPQLTGKSISNTNQEFQKETALVTRVIDGDTIEVKINESTQKVRLLGINTPEKNNIYYNEAKDFLKEIENKSIEILRDKEDSDKYDRKLRYIFYNNRIINIELLEQGYATTFMTGGLKYEEKLKNAEMFAKNNEIGLWEKSSHICSDCIKLLELNPDDEFFVLRNICSFECNLENWTVKDDANHFFKLDKIGFNEIKTYNSKKQVWNNNRDRFFMRDEKGKLVIFYEYDS